MDDLLYAKLSAVLLFIYLVHKKLLNARMEMLNWKAAFAKHYKLKRPSGVLARTDLANFLPG
jgi:hypothetical protein